MQYIYNNNIISVEFFKELFVVELVVELLLVNNERDGYQFKQLPAVPNLRSNTYIGGHGVGLGVPDDEVVKEQNA